MCTWAETVLDSIWLQGKRKPIELPVAVTAGERCIAAVILPGMFYFIFACCKPVFAPSTLRRSGSLTPSPVTVDVLWQLSNEVNRSGIGLDP